METIDMTPTWSALLPAMLEVLTTSKNNSAKEAIKAELKNMAYAADLYVESKKTNVQK
jgi:hypothetical protein